MMVILSQEEWEDYQKLKAVSGSLDDRLMDEFTRLRDDRTRLAYQMSYSRLTSNLDTEEKKNADAYYQQIFDSEMRQVVDSFRRDHPDFFKKFLEDRL